MNINDLLIYGRKYLLDSQIEGVPLKVRLLLEHILNMKDIKLIGVKKILFIENKASYISYIRNKKSDEFVIFHGGVYSPVKGEFFRKIYEASLLNETCYYHWSDIDLGGFYIFARLRDNIIKELKPYKMDIDTLLEYKDSWQHFDEKYKKKL